MFKKIISASFCAAFLFLSSCYYDNEETLYPGGSPCDVSSVTFQSVIRPIIDQKCATSGCHVSGNGRKVLSTDQGVKDIADDGRLKDWVITRRAMPPSQPLSSCEMAAIQAWIDLGAPIN